MQIQSIQNNRTNVRFSSDKDVEKAKAFVNMDDSQLRTLAYIKAQDKNEEKKSKKSIISTLYAIPLVDSLSSGILTRGRLGTRATATATTAARWGVALAVLGGYNAAKNAVVSRSEKLQNFEQNNPVISLLADVGVLMGALSLGTKGATKLGLKALGKAPKLTETLFIGLQNTKRIINKSMLNKKALPFIMKNVAKLEKKAPWAVAAGANIIANSVLITFLAGIFHGNSQVKQLKKDVEQNYKDLKTAQLNTSKHLTNVLSVKNDVLAQDSPIASELNEHVR